MATAGPTPGTESRQQAKVGDSRTAFWLDLADVLGQPLGGAAEIPQRAAITSCLLGPPGTGKTMLAERIPGILPSLDPAAALEVTSIHSIAGTLPHRAVR